MISRPSPIIVKKKTKREANPSDRSEPAGEGSETHLPYTNMLSFTRIHTQSAGAATQSNIVSASVLDHPAPTLRYHLHFYGFYSNLSLLLTKPNRTKMKLETVERKKKEMVLWQ